MKIDKIVKNGNYYMAYKGSKLWILQIKEAINLDDIYIKKTIYWRKYPHKFLKEFFGLKVSFIRVKWLKMRSKYAKLS